jgi:hypothetical protein
MGNEKLRVQIASDMRKRGVAPVAREWGVTREGLMAFALGVESRGVRALVEQKAAERSAK